MRPGSILSALSLLFIYMAAILVPPCMAEIEEAVEQPIEKAAQSDKLSQLTRSLSPQKVKEVIQKAPDKYKLRANNFLGTGLRRKSIAGTYGTSIAVMGGAGAITYQGLNLQSKNREQENKDKKDQELKQAICTALQERRDKEASVLTVVSENTPVPPSSTTEVPPLAPPSARWQNRYKFSNRSGDDATEQEASRPKADWDKRALDDATLNAIEEYNKFIAGTEAVVSGSIALAAAHQAHERALKTPPPEFTC